MKEQQMTRKVSKGKCSLCGGIFSKAAMTKHLESCRQRKAISETPSSNQRLQKTKTFHLVVEGRKKYWMHLSAPANATLEDLDNFLRDIWLECCGHLSAFTIQGKRYVSQLSSQPFLFEKIEEYSMDIALRKVLHSGMKFYHEYDFGTTTELILKVISEQEDKIKEKSIQLLARNEHPLIICESCGKIATEVCTECLWESGKGWLCDECAQKHECDEDMFLPVVNSPRVGLCGYTG